MANLTKKGVDRLRPKEERYTEWDGKLSGFGVRVSPKGKKTYVLKYRFEGRQRWLTIGQHGEFTPDEARDEAEEKAQMAKRGTDPGAVRDEARSSETVEELVESYLADRGVEPHLKKRTVEEYRRVLELHVVPAVGTIRVKNVTKADFSRLHSAMKEKPYQANRALAVSKVVFNFAEELGLRKEWTNPVRGIKFYPEKPKERLLTPKEIERLGTILKAAEDPGLWNEAKGDYVKESPIVTLALRLLLLTGCRKGEILCLKWDHVDFENTCLRLPDSKTGAKLVPLGGPVIQLLSEVPRVKGVPWVLPGKRRGGHLANLNQPWGRIRKAAHIEDVRIHDLRHAFASYGIMGGVDLTMVGGILGHQHAETTKRYAHLANGPLVAAAEKITQELSSTLESGEESAEILQFKGGA